MARDDYVGGLGLENREDRDELALVVVRLVVANYP